MQTKSKTKLISSAIFLAWFFAGMFFVPVVITDAYNQESISILNSIISGQDSHQPEHYLRAWRKAHGISLIMLLGVLLLPNISNDRVNFVHQRFVKDATPEALGSIRFWVFLILFMNLIWEDLPSVRHLPVDLRTDMGVMSIIHKIPGYDAIYANNSFLVIAEFATIIACLFAMVGFGTRWCVPIASFLAIIHGGILREYSHFFHTCLLPIQLSIALSFMPCGDGLSVDAYLASDTRTSSYKQVRYGWSRFTCWLLVAAAYTSAGFSKLFNGGWLWWSGDNLKKIVLTDTLNTMHFEWGLEYILSATPTWFFGTVGLLGLITECCFGFVLISRKARLVLPLLAIGMHIGILFFQGILFFDMIMIHAIFFSWRFLQPETIESKSSINDKLAQTQTKSQNRMFWLWGITAISLFGCWLSSIEKYPLSSWQMYSHRTTNSIINYKKVFAIYSDGTRTEAPIENWIGALADTRYRDILVKVTSVQDTFFRKLIDVANARSPHRKIVQFEVVTYSWDFKLESEDKCFGDVSSVARFPVDYVNPSYLSRKVDPPL